MSSGSRNRGRRKRGANKAARNCGENGGPLMVARKLSHNQHTTENTAATNSNPSPNRHTHATTSHTRQAADQIPSALPAQKFRRPSDTTNRSSTGSRTEAQTRGGGDGDKPPIALAVRTAKLPRNSDCQRDGGPRRPSTRTARPPPAAATAATRMPSAPQPAPTHLSPMRSIPAQRVDAWRAQRRSLPTLKKRPTNGQLTKTESKSNGQAKSNASIDS